MKKKICYITTISLTIRAFFIPQLKYLAENGYEVSVICSPDESLQKDLGENIRFIPVEIARGISPTTLIGSILKLKRIFTEEKFDLVQYSTPNAAFVASIAAKIAKVKVRNYHLMGFRYIGANGILRCVLKTLEKITCNSSSHIECVSKSNLDFGIKEKLFSAEKSTVVWNGSSGGVDMARFDHQKRQEWREEVRRELGYKEDDFIFGFVGRITKDKGLDELLQAFLPISNRAKLFIVGSDEGVQTLNQSLLKEAQDNQNVMFHKAVQDIERYFSAIDVLVLPSYREGFGMVIAESAAMGTPAIVSNIPGPVDAVIPDKTAFVVKVRDAEDLKNKMEIFLNYPALCKQMGTSCVNFVSETFDNRVLCEKILERKESLLS